MKVSFHGAAQEVTGSQHLIENNGHAILLDCGLFQGRREETYRKNRHPTYSVPDLDAVVLSHAHLDHCGKLPRLAPLGFEGKIHTTAITAELCDPMLKDSAHVQEKDIEFVNKLHRKKGLPPFHLLYGLEEVEQILPQFQNEEYHRPFEPAPGTRVTLINAGHVLGSAQILLELEERGKKRKIGFTGDLGRFKLPILQDPEQLSDLDELIIECTYGNRDHEPMLESSAELLEVIRHAHKRGGKVIIPAFALERTQELLFLLASLYGSGDLPEDMPVYVDSPLATKATEVFERHPEVYDRETKDLIKQGINPFEFPGLHFTRTVEESKALNDNHGPMIIIAASGMMEAGRILHHLRNNIESPKNTILIVSYQAEHTLGRRILEGRPEVRIFGEPFQLRAQVKVLNTFSGHAGRADLLVYLTNLVKNSPRLKRIFLVHGEESQAMALMETLKTWNSFEVLYPPPQKVFEL